LATLVTFSRLRSVSVHRSRQDGREDAGGTNRTMKSIERHKLKENDFARTVAHARGVLESRKRGIGQTIVAVVVVIAALAGVLWWRHARSSAATELLASALAVYDAPVVPIAPPAPGSAPPIPQPGTYQTEREKLEAALPRFKEVADKYQSGETGIIARYHLGSILAGLGQYSQAEQQYQQVVDKGGSSIYARTGRLGLADVQVAQGKYDNAITIYTELSRDNSAAIPVDSVLMQLGRAYARAGRKEEAARTFDRVVQEFPQSQYVADARRELDEARKS
jgi:tetratricopeptide (TPR) repeat protein